MSVPTYDKFIEPVLRFIAAYPEGVLARDAHEAAALALGLTDADRQELLPSGMQLVYKNRIGWAHDRLKRAGLSGSLRRGLWCITKKGLTFLAQHPAPFSQSDIEQLALGFRDRRLKPTDSASVTSSNIQAVMGVASPDDRLGEALSELRRAVTEDLRHALAAVSPLFFETIVLDLLHRMGYGTSRAALRRVGGSGDGGIDGVISLDKLGLEKVYVQAKRWQGTVGRPEIQGFYGALAGQRANKGVFITTSTYTIQAVEFAKSVEGIILVDGPRLAELMIDHEVGVSARTIKISKIDSDYFDEESV